MGETILQNFRWGLDSRRSTLTSQIGTLTSLLNAHINQGGECEKRKAFVGVDLTPTANSHVTATFGMEALQSSIVIFGGETNDDSANWPPSGFTYQKLARTATNYPYTPTATATGVVCSTVFEGLAFVIATMSDNTTLAFYNGVPVYDLTNGVVLASMTPTQVMKMLLAMVNASGLYTATFAGTVTDPVIVTGPGSAAYTVSTDTPAAWNFNGSGSAPVRSSTGKRGVSATYPSGGFSIRAGANGNTITSVLVNGNELLSGTVTYTTDNTRTAELVADAINDLTTTTGYSATADNGTVVLVSTTAGDDANGHVVSVTATGSICIGDCILEFAGTGFVLSYLQIDDTNNPTQSISLLSGALTYPSPSNESLTTFVARVASNINGRTATTGYQACQIGNALRISRKVTTSADPLLVVSGSLTVSSGATGSIVEPGSSIPSISIEPSIISIYAQRSGNSVRAFATAGPFKAVVTGGIAPYTYQWVVDIAAGAPTQMIVADTPTEGQTNITCSQMNALPPKSASLAARAKCFVTDAAGVTVESAYVTIMIFGA